MPYSENGRAAAIRESLERQGVLIVEEVEYPTKYDGRKGINYDDLDFIVAPAHEVQSVSELNAFADSLLPDVEPVFRREAHAERNEAGIATRPGRIKSFEPVGHNWFRRINVIVDLGPQAAVQQGQS